MRQWTAVLAGELTFECNSTLTSTRGLWTREKVKGDWRTKNLLYPLEALYTIFTLSFLGYAYILRTYIRKKCIITKKKKDDSPSFNHLNQMLIGLEPSTSRLTSKRVIGISSTVKLSLSAHFLYSSHPNFNIVISLMKYFQIKPWKRCKVLWSKGVLKFFRSLDLIFSTSTISPTI